MGFKAWWNKKKAAPVENSRVMKVSEATDVDLPEYDTSWEMGKSDQKMVDSLVAEMQRTGAVSPQKKAPSTKPKHQTVEEIGKMLQETAEGLDEEDNRDNDFYSDEEANAEMLARQDSLGETVFENPIFDGGDDDGAYDREPSDVPPLDEEDYYRYGPGGQTHGRML